MSPARRRLAALALPLAAWGILAAVTLERRDRLLLIDFNSFYVAARAAGDGADVYDTGALRRLAEADGIPGWVFPYLYPPPLAYFGQAWGALDPAPAQALWLWFHLAAALAAAALSALAAQAALARGGGLPAAGTGAAGANASGRAAAIWVPAAAAAAGVGVLRFFLTLDMGQVNLLVLAFVALACLFFFRGRDGAAGAVLAAAALIKVSPALLLVWAVARRRWRVLGGFAAAAAAIALATLPLGGLDAWRRFFEVLPERGHGSRIPGMFPAGFYPNFSFAGLFARLLGDRPEAVAAASAAAILALAALLALAAHRLRGRPGEELMLLPFLVLMIAATPYAYIHHAVFLLPGAALAAGHVWLSRRGASRIGWLAALATLAALASLNFPLRYETWTLPPWAMKAATSINLYVLLALLALGTWLALRAGRARPAGAAKTG